MVMTILLLEVGSRPLVDGTTTAPTSNHAKKMKPEVIADESRASISFR
jgi:hypothetical protein